MVDEVDRDCAGPSAGGHAGSADGGCLAGGFRECPADGERLNRRVGQRRCRDLASGHQGGIVDVRPDGVIVSDVVDRKGETNGSRLGAFVLPGVVLATPSDRERACLGEILSVVLGPQRHVAAC